MLQYTVPVGSLTGRSHRKGTPLAVSFANPWATVSDILVFHTRIDHLYHPESGNNALFVLDFQCHGRLRVLCADTGNSLTVILQCMPELM